MNTIWQKKLKIIEEWNVRIASIIFFYINIDRLFSLNTLEDKTNFDENRIKIIFFAENSYIYIYKIELKLLIMKLFYCIIIK